MESGYIRVRPDVLTYPTDSARAVLRPDATDGANFVNTSSVIFISCSRRTARRGDPGQASVDYVRTIPSVREFTKPRSFFSKLVDWVAGPPEDKPEMIRPTRRLTTASGACSSPIQVSAASTSTTSKNTNISSLKGPRGRDFISPIDVACDDNDNIYVSDSVRALDLRLRFAGPVSADHRGRDAGIATRCAPPACAWTARARRLYLTDTLRHQVLVFGSMARWSAPSANAATGQANSTFPRRSRSRPEGCTSWMP